jgi:hypothetical protein
MYKDYYGSDLYFADWLTNYRKVTEDMRIGIDKGIRSRAIISSVQKKLKKRKQRYK